MEAKDTVMSEEELGIFWRNPDECNDVGIAETQARITWKLAVREVVEWVEANLQYPTRGEGLVLKRNMEWQAKLKEWGLK